MSNQKLVLNLEVDLCAHICSYLRELLQILPAEEYTTCKRNGCVKLRQEESGLGSEEPISVPTLLQDAAAAYPDVRTHLLLYYSKYSILTLYNKSSKGKGSSFWYRTSLLKSTHKLFFFFKINSLCFGTLDYSKNLPKLKYLIFNWVTSSFWHSL